MMRSASLIQRFWDSAGPWLGQIDWRVWAVLGALALAVIGTICVFFSGIDIDPVHKFGAIFASWVGALALFVVSGVVVAIVSLAQPERESFDARARILFRRQSGKHIDYIVNRLRHDFEQYAEHTSVRFTVTGYDVTEKKYKITYGSKVTVRSYLDDVITSYRTSVEYKGVTPAPAGKEPNSLVYVRVNEIPVGKREDFQTE
jgi:hypothetical protein